MEELKDITEKEYRALPIESYSSLKYLLKSSKDYFYQKTNPFKGSNSTLLGTAIHNYLQGNRHWVAFSIIDKRKKEEYAKFESDFREMAGEDGIIVPKSFEKTLEMVMKSANDSANVMKLINNVQIEVPVVADYKGLKYKAKVDGLGDDYVLEIKSSSQATTAQEFKDEGDERNYDLQAAMYLFATGKRKHYFVVANTVAPFKVAAYKTSEKTIAKGYEKLNKIVKAYQKYVVDKEVDEDGDFEEV